MLLAKDYIFNDDDPITAEGDLVKIRSKTYFKALGSYGCCMGRKTEWTFRVDPGEIRALGEKPVIPELDGVDAVLDRLWHGKPATTLAAPSVIMALEPMVAKQRKDETKSQTPVEEVAMLSDTAVRRSPAKTELCLVLDNFPGMYRAKIVHRLIFVVQPHGAYLKSLTIESGDDTTGCRSFDTAVP